LRIKIESYPSGERASHKPFTDEELAGKVRLTLAEGVM